MTVPFRVNPEVAASYQAVLRTKADRALLLGVTGELAEVASNLVAVDRSPARVAKVWPGNTDRRRAMVGDWFRLAFRDRCFGAALGDGVLNILEFPGSQVRIFEELARVLEPGATVVMRVFSCPDRCESLAAVRDDALAGRIRHFQAFKMRLAMAMVAASSIPNIRVRLIRDPFDHEFPDREALARAAGWSLDDIATIDLYENSPDTYCFPTQQQFLSTIPPAFTDARCLPVGTYELAERCPLLITELRP